MTTIGNPILACLVRFAGTPCEALETLWWSGYAPITEKQRAVFWLKVAMNIYFLLDQSFPDDTADTLRPITTSMPVIEPIASGIHAAFQDALQTCDVPTPVDANTDFAALSKRHNSVYVRIARQCVQSFLLTLEEQETQKAA